MPSFFAFRLSFKGQLILQAQFKCFWSLRLTKKELKSLNSQLRLATPRHFGDEIKVIPGGFWLNWMGGHRFST
jgi:hypothetical protein